MTYSTFDKTDKGREEIATRKYHLPPRLRTLLLLINGKHPTEDVLKKVGGIGLTQEHVTELLQQGYIQACVHSGSEQSTTAAQITMPTPEVQHETGTLLDQKQAADGENSLQALYDFYTQTIRKAVGLNGYALQIKVERARSVDDFRRMRFDYLRAVIKAQGEAAAKELDKQLLQLLQTETPPS